MSTVGDTTWRLGVTVRPGEVRPSSRADEPPTKRFSLDLTPQQMSVLTAYCEPPSRGRAEPATHKEVAAALNYHPNTVREVLYEIVSDPDGSWVWRHHPGNLPVPAPADSRWDLKADAPVTLIRGDWSAPSDPGASVITIPP